LSVVADQSARAPGDEEALAQRSARRIALALMALSAVAAIAIIALAWVLLRRV
jgi:hypothetical protein